MTAHGTPLASTPLADDAGGLANTLTPFRFDNANLFPTHVVQPGPVTLTQGLRFDDPDTFRLATLIGGIANILPPKFPAPGTPDIFYLPTVATPVSALQPGLFTNTNTFYTAVFGGAGVLQPDLFQNTNLFYTPVVTGGAPRIIQDVRFDDPDTFPVHVVTRGTIALQPPFLSDLPDTFFGPVRVDYIPGEQPGGGKGKKKVLKYRDPNAELAAILAEKFLLEQKARAAWLYDRKRKMWAAAAALLMDY